MANFFGFKGERTRYSNFLNKASSYNASPAGAYLVIAGSASPAKRLVQMMRFMIEGENPRLSPGGFAYFSYLFAQTDSVKSLFGNIPESAIVAGMLTARWLIDPTEIYTYADLLAHVERLRTEMVTVLARNDRTLLTAIGNMKANAIPAYDWATSPGTILGTDPHVTTQINTGTNQARKILIACEAGGLPWAAFGTNMATIDADTVTSTDILASLMPASLPANWTVNVTSEEILSICNFVARHNPEEVKPITMRSLFICTTGISKGPNLTPAWMASRWNSLKGQYPDIVAGRVELEKEMVKDYYTHFIGNNVSLGNLYSSLMFTHQLASELQVHTLRWIIEQAKGVNTTALGAIARAVTMYDTFTHTILSRVIPETDFSNAISAMLSTIQQPYVTLHRPAMSMGNYANLAYVALSLSMSTGVEGLIASAKSKMTANEMSLGALMTTIRSCQQESANALTGMGVLLSAYKVNAVPSPNNLCTALAYPNFQDAAIEAVGDDNVVIRNLAGLNAVDLQGISNQLKSFSMKEIVTVKRTDRDQAFAEIASAYSTAINQIELTNVFTNPGDQGRYAPAEIPQTILNRLNLFNVTAPPVIPIAVTAADELPQYTISRFP